MSRIICPYSEDMMTCIVENISDDIDCDKCWIKKELEEKEE